MAEVLAAHLEGDDAHVSELDLSAEERAELASLLHVADRLDAQMEPRRPPSAFVQSLGVELVREAERRMAKREKRHRIAVISAAVAGGIVSIASLVGGIVVLIKWLRTRSEARQASTA
jgi:histone acetyltransferase (RNA polymerase elongator complex component)